MRSTCSPTHILDIIDILDFLDIQNILDIDDFLNIQDILDIAYFPDIQDNLDILDSTISPIYILSIVSAMLSQCQNTLPTN